MSITLVACIDMGFGIGDINGELLYKIPQDQKHFKSVTSGKIVVMGRITWESLPKKPLEKRKNYILSTDITFNPTGAKVVDSIDEVLKLSKVHDVMIIGGGSVYEQFLPYASKMLLTHIHEVSLESTAFFPKYEDREWKVKSIVKHDKSDNHPSFTFAEYERIIGV